MKKAIVWIKMTFLALPMALSSFHSRKQPFAIVYDTARLWTLMFLKNIKVKIKIHNKNYLPLKEGVLFVVQHGSSIDQEVVLSSMMVPFISVLTKEKRLFLLSKSWQKRLQTVVNPRKTDEARLDVLFQEGRNVVNFTDSIETVNEACLLAAMKYDYPVVLIDIINAKKALDTQIEPQVVVDVKFTIPIVEEEYKECSLSQLKHIMHIRNEGNVYEHD
jgi:hypothetical protein